MNPWKPPLHECLCTKTLFRIERGEQICCDRCHREYEGIDFDGKRRALLLNEKNREILARIKKGNQNDN